MQRTETTAEACKQVKDEAAATSEHAEGHNEAIAVAGKGRNEASAAKKTSDREDILRSQNNTNGRGEEEDDEIMTLIDARRKIKREGKERIKEESKKIKQCIRTRKSSRRQERIQRIFTEFQGVNNISNIKSAKKRTLIPKTKKTLTIVLAHSVMMLLCLVTSFATLVTRTFRDRKIHGLIAVLSGTSFSLPASPAPLGTRRTDHTFRCEAADAFAEVQHP